MSNHIAVLVSQNVQRFIHYRMMKHHDEDICHHWRHADSVCVPDVIDMFEYVTRQMKADWLCQWPKSEEFKLLHTLSNTDKIQKENKNLKKVVATMKAEKEALKTEMAQMKENFEKLKKQKNYEGVQKPKKPKTAWIVYQKKEREILKTENPELANRLILKEIGKRWKALKEKVAMGDEAAAARMESISAEVADDKKRYTEEDNGAQNDPKPRNKSMYQSWCAKYRAIFKNEGLRGADLRARISSGWKQWKKDQKEGKCEQEIAEFMNVQTSASQGSQQNKFKKNRVAELRAVLTRKGLDSTGRKKVLVERLIANHIFPPFTEEPLLQVDGVVVAVEGEPLQNNQEAPPRDDAVPQADEVPLADEVVAQDDEEELASYLQLQEEMEKEAQIAQKETRRTSFIEKKGLRIESRQDVIDLDPDEARDELSRRNLSTQGCSKECRKRLAKATGFYNADQTRCTKYLKFPDGKNTDWNIDPDTLTQERCNAIWNKISPKVSYFRIGWILRELNIVTNIPQVHLCLLWRRKIHPWAEEWCKTKHRVVPDSPRRLRWLDRDATLTV